jgi:hypothetical protein
MNVRTFTPYVSSSHTPAPAKMESSAHSSRLGVALSEMELLLPLPALVEREGIHVEVSRVLLKTSASSMKERVTVASQLLCTCKQPLPRASAGTQTPHPGPQ